MKLYVFKNPLLLSCLCFGLVPLARAQPDITWQPPVTISGPADVSTNGFYFGSWAPQDGNAIYYPVSGINFHAYPDLPNFTASSSFDDGYTGYGSPNTSDANYNFLLQSGRYADGGDVTASFSWNGMLPNHAYEVQVWVNDARNIGQSRYETLTGGSSTSASVYYGSDGSGPGQYIIGTFVADYSRSMTISFTPYSTGANPTPQVNLVQVRDVTTNGQPDITWQAPVTILGPGDVSTSGVYFGSWAPNNGSANSYPVNGVTFQGFSDLPYFSPGPTWDNGYNGFGSPNTPDSNYNSLLQYARFSNEQSMPATISWGGMTPGNTYQLQLWVNDGRNIGQTRTETITAGKSTSAPLSFGSDGSGPGQYIIGTFVADSSGYQTLRLDGFSTGANPDPQVNILQVRDITGVVPPTPPTITSLSIHGTTLNLTAINGPANGSFVLLQTTNLQLPLSQWSPIASGSFDGTGNLAYSGNVVAPDDHQAFYVLRIQSQ